MAVSNGTMSLSTVQGSQILGSTLCLHPSRMSSGGHAEQLGRPYFGPIFPVADEPLLPNYKLVCP